MDASDFLTVLFCATVASAVVCGFIGREVATRYKLAENTGWLLGLLMGPMGVVAVVLLGHWNLHRLEIETKADRANTLLEWLVKNEAAKRKREKEEK